MRHRTKTIVAYAVVVVIGAVICLIVAFARADLGHPADDFKDDMGEDIVPDPGYEYSISNVAFNLSFELESTVEVDGELVSSETVYINIWYECELYSISCLLNEDGKYDLVIDIVGLYLNFTMTNDEGQSGGSLTIDEFHYSGIVDECTETAIKEALLEVAQLDQWGVPE